jgi:lipoprotein LprG
MPAARLAPLALALTGVLLAGCSGNAETVSSGRTSEEVMELARTTLDETSGVRLSLTGEGLPEGISALRAAEGVGVHPQAFDGTLTVVLSGTDFNVPVVAVDGEVHAQIPLTPGWQTVDPAAYGAPDPAQLMSTDAGFSSLLTETDDLEEGESVRGGVDNKEVLTEFTGEVDGAAVQRIIPSADAETTFEATYLITADGELREADLTGVFYPDTEPMTYALTFEEYGTEQDVTAP